MKFGESEERSSNAIQCNSKKATYWLMPKITMSEEILSTDSSHRKDESDPATLSELFDNAFELSNSINNTAEPTNSTKVQVRFSNSTTSDNNIDHQPLCMCIHTRTHAYVYMHTFISI